MISIDEPVYFTAPDGSRYRVTVHYDSDTTSPREWDNVTIMHTFDSRWNSPDGGRSVYPLIPSDYVETNTVGGPVDMRRARRYEALFDADCLAIAGLHRGHDGTLSLSFGEELDRIPRAPGATISWEADGYCMITAQRWEAMMGDTAFTTEQGAEFMQQDIDVYNKWANGEFTAVEVEQELNWQGLDADGNVVEDRTMTSWDTTEFVGGFDDEDDAFQHGVEMLPEGSDRED